MRPVVALLSLVTIGLVTAPSAEAYSGNPQSSSRWRACSPYLDGVRTSVDQGQRTVTIVRGSGSSYARVSFWVRTNSTCDFSQKFLNTGGRVGSSGITNGATRTQGTNTTPSGTYTMTEAFGLQGASAYLPYRRVQANDFWVEDNNSPYYNSYRNSRDGGFDANLPATNDNGSERLTNYPGRYDYAIVVNFNRTPDYQVRGRGAGIFLHVTGRGATAGCVSVSASQMRTMLGYMKPNDKITIQ